MYINSIFLPKSSADQTNPQSISEKISSFSHLFTNVFHIIKDDQDKVSLVTSQDLGLNSDSQTNDQTELLNVSLSSESNLTLENLNITDTISSYLSNVGAGEKLEGSPLTNNIKINGNSTKYFGLSKKNFLDELKSLIDSFRKSDSSILGNVEVSLIAGGQSLKINPAEIQTPDLVKWVNEQLQSNSDFEILVKKSPEKLLMNSEKLQKNASQAVNSLELNSELNNIKVELISTPISLDKDTSQNSLLTKKSEQHSSLENNFQEVKQTNISDSSKISTNKLFQMDQFLDDVPTESGKEISLKNTQEKYVYSDSGSKITDSNINQADKQISLKLNDKVNPDQTDGKSLQQETELTDLMKKTNVKEIELNIQKFAKPISENAENINLKYDPEIYSNKEKQTKRFAPELVDQIGKVDSNNDEIATVSAKESLESSSNTKIDIMARRAFSQIPPLEVILENSSIKNLKKSPAEINSAKDENIDEMNSLSKSAITKTDQKINPEKEVWVKVVFGKNENEIISENKKSSVEQMKITVDSDGMEQNVKQNNNSTNEFPDNVNIKPTTVNLDANTNTEIKQATNNQNPILGIKPEIKVENSILKTELPHEGTHLNSRTTEMVEKIKYISSGEMIREVYKAFESGEKQSIVLRLVPKELGSIKITLDTIDNVLNAKVEVQNETVGNLIRSNSDLLKQNLLQNGVHINSLNISYQNSEQKQHGFTNQKRKHPFYLPDNDIEEVDDSLITKKMGYNTYEYLA